jgi:hypothetical protein
MAVVVRTHGGLGNQLFQIVFARLSARARYTGYAELHDMNYSHGFKRSSELEPAPLRATGLQRRISGLRIPKLLLRSGLWRTEQVALFGSLYLDGYFQRAADFERFSDAQIAAEVGRLRRELRIEPSGGTDTRTLYHIRLGDFFDDAGAALAHALKRVDELPPHATVITNQDELFQDAQVQQRMQAKQCRLHCTSDYASGDVIRLMSTHGRIVTNNSTLALWASVLGNSRTEFDDCRLAAVHDRLFKAANARHGAQ